MSSDDPWDWDVNQVVHYLCHSHSSWAGQIKGQYDFPDTIVLERHLREQGIRGWVLLTAVDHDLLKSEFGIRSISQRAAVILAVKLLRDRSFKYNSQSGGSTLQAPEPVSTPTPAPIPPPLPTSLPSPADPTPLSAVSSSSRSGASKHARDEDPASTEQSSLAAPPKKRRLDLSTQLTTTPLDAEPNEPTSAQSLSKYTSRVLSIDDVFFPNYRNQDPTDLPAPDNTPLNFSLSFSRPVPPSGQAAIQIRFVGRAIRSFLWDADRENYFDGDKKVTAMYPYHKRWQPKQERQRGRIEFKFLPDGITAQPVIPINDEWTYLEKWNQDAKIMSLEELDEVDSICGEEASASEEDSVIVEEADEDDNLSPESVEYLVDLAIQRYIDLWKTTKFPKLAKKEQSELTKLSQWRTDRERVTVKLQAEIGHYESLLSRHKNEIVSQRWSSVEEVDRICAVVEQTVYNREECRWRMSIVDKSSQRPDAVRRRVKYKRNPAAKSAAKPKKPDEMEGFIIPDDPVRNRSPVDMSMRGAAPLESDVLSPSRQLTEDVVPDSDAEFRAKSVPAPESESPVMPEAAPELTPHPESEQDAPEAGPVDEPKSPGRRSKHKPNPQDEESHENNDNVIDLEATKSEPEDTQASTSPRRHRSLTPPSTAVLSHPEWPSFLGPNIEVINLYSDSSDDGEDGEDGNTEDNGDDTAAADDPKAKDPDFWNSLESSKNGGRLLRSVVFRLLSDDEASSLSDILDRKASMWVSMRTTLKWLSAGVTKDTPIYNEGLVLISRLFLLFLDCQLNHYSDPLSKLADKAHKTLGNEFKRVPPATGQIFFSVLSRALNQKEEYDGDHDVTELQSDAELNTQESSAPVNLRTKHVSTNKQAKQVRADALRRQADQASREEFLKHHPVQYSGDRQIPINILKKESQPEICLHPAIGSRVQPHQVEGIRFMWREVISAAEKAGLPQGCLLAHTMGLGKTMQTIAFLVTVAEAARSPDPKINKQIPAGLKKVRMLVCCPSGLVDNWMGEFEKWSPKPISATLIQVQSITSEMPKFLRLSILKSWYKEGGVLVIGFSLLVLLSDVSREKDYPGARKKLLEGPRIVVADEAHNLRNPDSKIANVVRTFKTTARVALTGSPLANNLREYYSLVDWISPGYLGPIQEFSARFQRPIEAGFYASSLIVQRRVALKWLAVLKKDLEPKVNRADITVLKGQLPPKMEFILTVPLTKLQKKCYSTFVEHIRNARDIFDSNTSLWACTSALMMLCNHPSIFHEKMFGTIKSSVTNAIKDKDGCEDDIDDSEYNAILQDSKLKELVMADFNGVELLSESLSVRTTIFTRIVRLTKDAGEQLLAFTHSLGLLSYLETILKEKKISYVRLDGSTRHSVRNERMKAFNQGQATVFLVSSRAGGYGFNMPAASRVLIFDSGFNPVHEEQAVARAYRMGQTKPVYVYRFVAGGTFQEQLNHQSVFKTQLALRVNDAKNLKSLAMKPADYIYTPKTLSPENLDEYKGKDAVVLDQLIADSDEARGLNGEPWMYNITTMDNLRAVADDDLTPEELQEVTQILTNQKLLNQGKAPGNSPAVAAGNAHAVAAGNAPVVAPAPPAPGPSLASTSTTYLAPTAAFARMGRPAPKVSAKRLAAMAASHSKSTTSTGHMGHEYVAPGALAFQSQSSAPSSSTEFDVPSGLPYVSSGWPTYFGPRGGSASAPAGPSMTVSTTATPTTMQSASSTPTASTTTTTAGVTSAPAVSTPTTASSSTGERSGISFALVPRHGAPTLDPPPSSLPPRPPGQRPYQNHPPGPGQSPRDSNDWREARFRALATARAIAPPPRPTSQDNNTSNSVSASSSATSGIGSSRNQSTRPRTPPQPTPVPIPIAGAAAIPPAPPSPRSIPAEQLREATESLRQSERLRNVLPNTDTATNPNFTPIGPRRHLS